MRTGPHPFTLRQLQYVCAVAEELSFRRAAARCHVSQPSLSAQIAQIEAALGVRLFERSQRRVLLAAAGRDVVDRARRLLLDADDLEAAATRAKDPLSGTIRIGVIPTIAPYLLPIAAPALRAKFPRLMVSWREDKTDVVIAALAGGTLDAALVALEANLGDVERIAIGEDPFFVALPPGHSLARAATPVETSALRGDEVLLLEEGHCLRDQALEVCTHARAREGEYRATSLMTLLQMVASGAGITLLPALAVSTEATRAGLRVRAIASRRARRTIGLVWRRRSALDAALRRIGAELAASFPSFPQAIALAGKPRRRGSRR